MSASPGTVPPGRLAYLVKEVRAARTPAARLRIAARTWRILRRLSPAERARFATELGLHGAGETLERLAAGPGHEMAAELTALADRAEKADPSQVQSLLTQLRHPAKRHDLLEHGLHTLADQVASLLGAGVAPAAGGVAEKAEELGRDEEGHAGRGARAGVRPPAAVRPDEAARPEVPSWARDEEQPPRPHEGFRTADAALQDASEPGWEEWVARTTQAAAAGAVAGAVAAATRGGAETAPPAASFGAPPASPDLALGDRPAGPAAAEPALVPLAPAPAPPPASVPTAAAGTQRTAAAATAAEATGPSIALPGSPLFEPLHALPSPIGTNAPSGLTARFRALRRCLATHPAPEDAELALLLADFPSGWAHRRALSAALQAGLPHSLDQAAGLVLALPSPSDRRWCWSALFAGRTLTPADRERLAAAEPSPPVRRRLAPAVGHDPRLR